MSHVSKHFQRTNWNLETCFETTESCFLVLWFGTTLINVGFSRHSGSLTQTGTVSPIATTRLSIYGKINFSTLFYKISDA